jgi:hypothetical protein
VRQECQVLAQHVDSNRREHQEQPYPEERTAMRTPPVREARFSMNYADALRPFVPVIMVLVFNDWLHGGPRLKMRPEPSRFARRLKTLRGLR